MPKIVQTLVSSEQIFLGVDPGASGGLATIRGRRVELFQMPKTEKDIWNLIRQFRSLSTVCILEKVWGHIGQGQPGSAMFNFGMGYGLLKMALTGTGIPFEEVVPRAWQKALSISSRKKTETKTQWKNRLKATAQKLFPRVEVTLATCDALLIALYCKRKHEGTL